MLLRTFIFSILIVAQSACARQTIDKSCEADQAYNFNVFSKKDVRFTSEVCISDSEEQYVKSYYALKGSKKLISRVDGGIDGGQGVKLIAVSLYKRKVKNPILISIYSEKYCCYPKPTGDFYTVELHEFVKIKNSIELKSITHILGDDTSGLNGVFDDYLTFKFKDISSVKKWLDKNYK